MIDQLHHHHGQQLSGLIDGELSPDQARFLMRRLEHDADLKGCYERWQLCGDVLRGQAMHVASADLAERIAARISLESAMQPARQAKFGRRGMLRWGGGALAASVALMALFVAQQHPEELKVKADAATRVAVSAQSVEAPSPKARMAEAPADPPSLASVAAPVGQVPAPDAVRTTTAMAALGSVAPNQARPDRRAGSATRTQQVARAAQQRSDAPELAVAVSPLALTPLHRLSSEDAAVKRDPFVGNIVEPTVRPWPRSVLPRYSNSPYAASFGGGSAGFYPYEPQLRDPPVITPPGDSAP